MREYIFLAPKVLFFDGKRINIARFGQSLQLTEDQAKFVAESRGTIVTADVFNGLGFKPEDLRRFADIRNHDKGTPEFLDKKQRAIDAARLEMDALVNKGAQAHA